MTEITNFNYPNKDLRGYSFKGQNLTGANFSNSDISGCDFSEAILREANFKGVEVGIDWSNFTFLTILGVITFGFYFYSDSISSNDSSQRYVGHVQLLVVLIGFIFFVIIGSTDEIVKNNHLLSSVGIFLCLGMITYIIIIAKKNFSSFFRTSFRNADLTGAILDNVIIEKADLTGAILDNVIIEKVDVA
jgi:Pentapeptide repeats (8 copies)